MRPRIKNKSIEERLVDQYRRLYGIDTKQAWQRVSLLTLKSDMNYLNQ